MRQPYALRQIQRQQRRGATATELAVLLPLLVILCLTSVDFGRFAAAYIALGNATRVGAEQGATRPYSSNSADEDRSLIEAAVRNELAGTSYLDPETLEIEINVEPDAYGLHRVQVTAMYPFHTVVSWPTIPQPVELRRTVVFRRFARAPAGVRMMEQVFRSHPRRRGSTLVESTFVLSVCAVLLLGMLEMSLALVRHTAMVETSRSVAREAIVHGSLAAPLLEEWGPETLTISAADDHPAARAARKTLVTINPAEVQLEISWPDGDNQPNQRVRVAANYRHRPVVAIRGWYDELPLEGISTMFVAH
jgi:Flp pilus assembly protein TadG